MCIEMLCILAPSELMRLGISRLLGLTMGIVRHRKVLMAEMAAVFSSLRLQTLALCLGARAVGPIINLSPGSGIRTIADRLRVPRGLPLHSVAHAKVRISIVADNESNEGAKSCWILTLEHPLHFPDQRIDKAPPPPYWIATMAKVLKAQKLVSVDMSSLESPTARLTSFAPYQQAGKGQDRAIDMCFCHHSVRNTDGQRRLMQLPRGDTVVRVEKLSVDSGMRMLPRPLLVPYCAPVPSRTEDVLSGSSAIASSAPSSTKQNKRLGFIGTANTTKDSLPTLSETFTLQQPLESQKDLSSYHSHMYPAFRSSIELEADVKTVFTFLTDETARSSWDVGFKRGITFANIVPPNAFRDAHASASIAVASLFHEDSLQGAQLALAPEPSHLFPCLPFQGGAPSAAQISPSTGLFFKPDAFSPPSKTAAGRIANPTEGTAIDKEKPANAVSNRTLFSHASSVSGSASLPSSFNLAEGDTFSRQTSTEAKDSMSISTTGIPGHAILFEDYFSTETGVAELSVPLAGPHDTVASATDTAVIAEKRSFTPRGSISGAQQSALDTSDTSISGSNSSPFGGVRAPTSQRALTRLRYGSYTHLASQPRTSSPLPLVSGTALNSPQALTMFGAQAVASPTMSGTPYSPTAVMHDAKSAVKASFSPRTAAVKSHQGSPKYALDLGNIDPSLPTAQDSRKNIGSSREAALASAPAGVSRLPAGLAADVASAVATSISENNLGSPAVSQVVKNLSKNSDFSSREGSTYGAFTIPPAFVAADPTINASVFSSPHSAFPRIVYRHPTMAHISNLLARRDAVAVQDAGMIHNCLCSIRKTGSAGSVTAPIALPADDHAFVSACGSCGSRPSIVVYEFSVQHRDLPTSIEGVRMEIFLEAYSLNRISDTRTLLTRVSQIHLRGSVPPWLGAAAIDAQTWIQLERLRSAIEGRAIHARARPSLARDRSNQGKIYNRTALQNRKERNSHNPQRSILSSSPALLSPSQIHADLEKVDLSPALVAHGVATEPENAVPGIADAAAQTSTSGTMSKSGTNRYIASPELYEGYIGVEAKLKPSTPPLEMLLKHSVGNMSLLLGSDEEDVRSSASGSFDDGKASDTESVGMDRATSNNGQRFDNALVYHDSIYSFLNPNLASYAATVNTGVMLSPGSVPSGSSSPSKGALTQSPSYRGSRSSAIGSTSRAPRGSSDMVPAPSSRLDDNYNAGFNDVKPAATSSHGLVKRFSSLSQRFHGGSFAHGGISGDRSRRGTGLSKPGRLSLVSFPTRESDRDYGDDSGTGSEDGDDEDDMFEGVPIDNSFKVVQSAYEEAVAAVDSESRRAYIKLAFSESNAVLSAPDAVVPSVGAAMPHRQLSFEADESVNQSNALGASPSVLAPVDPLPTSISMPFSALQRQRTFDENDYDKSLDQAPRLTRQNSLQSGEHATLVEAGQRFSGMAHRVDALRIDAKEGNIEARDEAHHVVEEEPEDADSYVSEEYSYGSLLDEVEDSDEGFTDGLIAETGKRDERIKDSEISNRNGDGQANLEEHTEAMLPTAVAANAYESGGSTPPDEAITPLGVIGVIERNRSGARNQLRTAEVRKASIGFQPGTPEALTDHSEEKAPTSVGLADFELLAVLGRGGYGKVMLVRRVRRAVTVPRMPSVSSMSPSAQAAVANSFDVKYLERPPKDEGVVYAMKVMRKKDLKERRQIKRTLTERLILTKVRHPFVVGMRYAFQTRNKLYMVMDYVSGGDFFSLLAREGPVPEHRAVLYMAEIVLALEHLHSLGIVYRDLKPENVLLDADGYVITCFVVYFPALYGSHFSLCFVLSFILVQTRAPY
jgi:hypothetical protein